MKNLWEKIKSKLSQNYITISREIAEFFEIHEILTPENDDMNREILNQKNHNIKNLEILFPNGNLEDLSKPGLNDSNNAKTAHRAVSGSTNEARSFSLPSELSISSENFMSSISVEIPRAVEVGGIEPPSFWMVSQNSHQATPTADLLYQNQNIGESRIADVCPYCQSKDFVKRGTRKNRYQTVQLYLCRNQECGKTFTASDVKGKHFPLKIVIEGMSLYNLGCTLEQTCSILKQKFGDKVSSAQRAGNIGAGTPTPATLSDWINEYKSLCRYERLRPYAVKMFNPKNTVEVVTMAHRQLYRFRYHRAKTVLMLEEFKNRNLRPLKDYLDNVSSETPHQYFQDGERMSEIKSKFDKADMIVRGKFNYANKLAAFVLQAVKDNKRRHEELQRFMIANDSCTVATEAPVYIRKEDIEHMENQLNFKIASDGHIEIKGHKNPQPLPRLLTGHIDLVQIRNGQIHLLDYKPNAAKEKPIEQLTWYAMALSRLTGLRLFEFKCGWFDEKDYFEFYPLHVVKKLQPTKRKRRVFYRGGEIAEVPRENKLVIIKNK